MKFWRITISMLFVLLGQNCDAVGGQNLHVLPGFESDTLQTDSALVAFPLRNDSIALQNQLNLEAQSQRADTSLFSLQVTPEDIETAQPRPRFVPNPKRALWLSLVLPGAGQIYNRKYWKLPIVYGGFLGCTYAFMWNQQMYKDYSQAYLDIMDDDPATDSYLDMLPPRYDITGREEQFKRIFRNKRDYYRRYRDLSVFCFVGVYILSVIDAYVDAQLSAFDISKDLSMRLEPTVIRQTNGVERTNTLGLQCSFNF